MMDEWCMCDKKRVKRQSDPIDGNRLCASMQCTIFVSLIDEVEIKIDRCCRVDDWMVRSISADTVESLSLIACDQSTPNRSIH